MKFFVTPLIKLSENWYLSVEYDCNNFLFREFFLCDSQKASNLKNSDLTGKRVAKSVSLAVLDTWGSYLCNSPRSLVA